MTVGELKRLISRLDLDDDTTIFIRNAICDCGCHENPYVNKYHVASAPSALLLEMNHCDDFEQVDSDGILGVVIE